MPTNIYMYNNTKAWTLLLQSIVCISVEHSLLIPHDPAASQQYHYNVHAKTLILKFSLWHTPLKL